MLSYAKSARQTAEWIKIKSQTQLFNSRGAVKKGPFSKEKGGKFL